MANIKKTILPILITGIWINISETVRWVLIVEEYWIEHYQKQNLVFPTELGNVLTWMIWGFSFASVIFILLKKFTLMQTTFLSWFVTFVMLWLVLWNIDNLPVDILWIVIPLSLFETFIGVLICKKLIE